ncbi:hypothetical protein B0J18DRAFT_480335 [Chaetomium sp. MPI-SDFR-AT-0129]|nr:hypothetical protein B0J18DRAFT_480335 [Chaetomium sp. MPI-SDFR-AT-0129]
MPRDLLRAMTGGMSKKPGEPPLQPMITSQAIGEIEDALGDVGRGTDYPMARKRRGSSSSKDDTQPTGPPPMPPKHKLLRQIPVFESGTSLPLPRVRGASAPEHTTDGHEWNAGRENLLFEEDRDEGNRQEGNDFDLPIPPMPTWSPPPVPPPHTTPWYPPQELRKEAEGENSHQPVETTPAAAIITRRPPSASAPPKPAPKYSLFPKLGNRDPAKIMSSSPSPRASPKPPAIPARNPARMRQVSAVSMAASDVSRTSSSSYVAGGELPRPVQSSDLIPDASTIPPPPAFRHNWDTPNRARARGAVNPATSHHAGYTGRPVGSRPRPQTSLQQGQTTQTGPQSRDSLTAGTFPEPTIPVLFPEAINTATRAAFRQPMTATSARDSTAFQTGQFTYYPVMSPYEAEAAIGSGGTLSGVYQTVTTLPDPARGTTATASSESTATSRPTTAVTATGSSTSTISTVSSMSTLRSTFAPTPQTTSTQTSTPTPASMSAARMFPALDHDLMSAEQAAAAVEAARHVRNTIFIDRGFDMPPVQGGDEGGAGNGGNGGVNRSSSYYGEEKDEKKEEEKK